MQLRATPGKGGERIRDGGPRNADHPVGLGGENAIQLGAPVGWNPEVRGNTPAAGDRIEHPLEERVPVGEGNLGKRYRRAVVRGIQEVFHGCTSSRAVPSLRRSISGAGIHIPSMKTSSNSASG